MDGGGATVVKHRQGSWFLLSSGQSSDYADQARRAEPSLARWLQMPACMMSASPILKTIVITSLFSFSLAAAPSVEAQPGPGRGWRGSGGWGPTSMYQRNYDPSKIATLKGKIVEVQRIEHRRGMSEGVHLIVQVEKEKRTVHLGPKWFIERQDTELKVGDEVEIRGSLVKIGNVNALIAASVKKGNATLELRDSKGFPRWAGWRMGRRMRGS